MVAAGAFLAAVLLSVQVRGGGQPPLRPAAVAGAGSCLPAGSHEDAGAQPEPADAALSGDPAEARAQTGSPGDERAEEEPHTRPTSGPDRGPASSIDGEPVVQLLPVDSVSSVDEPRMVPAAEAGEFMRDDEMVIGVADGNQARAYSTWHLDHHEIVNDRLGETPIAATW
jgi:hypothetical protein